jgi:hypothetical protein
MRSMRILLPLALLVVVACSDAPSAAPPAAGAAASSAPTAAGKSDPARAGARKGTWARAESDRAGVPIVWEFREDAGDAQRKDKPQLLTVSWVYKAAADDAQPDPAQLAAFAAFEDRLLAALGDKAELVAVLTFNRQHNWYLYATDFATVDTVRELAKSETSAVDIKADAEYEPVGEFYTRLRKTVGVK